MVTSEKDTKLHFGENLSQELKEIFSKENTFVVVDENVSNLYSDLFTNAKVHIFKATEKNKTMLLVENICSFLLKQKANRHSTLVAVGGGITGDVVGFAASVYMRGISVKQVPTTLLAQVDSAIGGKTAANIISDNNLIKNAVGRFWFAKEVFISAHFLKTLPQNQFNCGIGEALKTAVLDKSIFDFYSKNEDKIFNKDKSALTSLVRMCASFKNDIVIKDPFETKGLRQILNFGHTLGHALESLNAIKNFSHGEYVMLGIKLEQQMFKKFIDEDFYNKLSSMINKVLGDTKIRIDAKKILQTALLDKKNRDGNISIVYAQKAGIVKEQLITTEEFLKELHLALINN